MRTIHLKADKDIDLIAVVNTPDTTEIEALEHFKFTVSFTMYVSQENNESIEDLSIAQNISYQKINHFLSYYVDHSLWYDKAGQDTIDKHFASTKNLLLITPLINPTYLGNCLFKKFNTLCKDNVWVDGLSIKDHSTDLTYTYRTDDPTEDIDILPTKDWPGEFSIYDLPWWFRDSISAYDYSCNSQEELEAIRLQIEDISIEEDFQLIEEEVVKQMGKDPNFKQEQGKVIQYDFKNGKPKKVD